MSKITSQKLTAVDTVISIADNALQTLFLHADNATRVSPAQLEPEDNLSDSERKLSASLMRINHTGEVCAQALYRGQALSADNALIAEAMQQAVVEEADHLAWCEQRLQQLGSHSSYLNPIFYSLSFAIGYATGKIGDEISLGFIAATEEQVCKHLDDHANRLPINDKKSQAIVQQMIIDERAHGENAIKAGGKRFSSPIKLGMTLFSKIMTETTARI